VDPVHPVLQVHIFGLEQIPLLHDEEHTAKQSYHVIFRVL